MKTGFRVWLVALALVVILLTFGWLMLAQGQGYTAFMQVCGDAVFLDGPHVRRFGDLASAQAWADGQLAGAYNLAYVWTDAELWAKADDGRCFGGRFLSWTRVPAP